jgi:hypothetical protein
MVDESVTVQIEGQDVPRSRGSAQRSIEEINAEAAEYERQAAEYNRQTAYWKAQSAQATRDNASMVKEAWGTEKQRHEEALQQAIEYGDAQKQIEAQRALREAETQFEHAQAYEHQLNTRPVSSGDPVEDFCRGRSQRDATWIRSHPEYITDPRKFAKLQAGHNDALAEGHNPNSNEYLAHIERFIGVRGATDGDDVASPRARQQSPRSTSGKVTLRLSREDDARLRETAESLGMDYQTYLKRYVSMKNDPNWQRLD